MTGRFDAVRDDSNHDSSQSGRAGSIAVRLGLVAALCGVIARLVVMEREASKEAADWRQIARTYRWKIEDHGKGWCR